jgi:murein DD-endopeptidase MepM/ murein hydrolase activator NlpD
MKTILTLFAFIIFIGQSNAQTYLNNEDGLYEDLLTPQYYNTPNGGLFRNDVNKLVHFAQLIPFQHPLTDLSGNIPTITITRNFGTVIGQGPNTEYHNARDMKVGNTDTTVVMFASIDGIVHTYRDALKYRDYATVTKNIEDSIGNILGKIVVLYGHLDIHLDSLDNRNLNGQSINRGDTISKHLYSGTAGGAHLHFEIRYYQNSDVGTETYYGKPNGFPFLTDPSAGSWSHGNWDPNFGYGFANPENHFNQTLLPIVLNKLIEKIKLYPNPTKDIIIIELNEMKQLDYSIYSLSGQLLEQKKVDSSNRVKINLEPLSSGIYLINLTDGEDRAPIRVVKE